MKVESWMYIIIIAIRDTITAIKESWRTMVVEAEGKTWISVAIRRSLGLGLFGRPLRLMTIRIPIVIILHGARPQLKHELEVYMSKLLSAH